MRRRVLISAIMTAAVTPAARALTKRSGPYRARAVALANFAGELRVGASADKDVWFGLEGPEKFVEVVRAELIGDRLTISVPVGSSGRNTVVRGSVSAIAKGGGTASVTIGGDNVTSDEPTILSLEVPSGSDLDLAGFVGEGRIDVAIGALRAELTAGNLAAGSVGPAELTIRGGGQISVAQVSGRLSMTLEGGGDITVRAGSVERVEAVLEGAGSLGFGGDARTGKVRASGAGTVTLGSVTVPPEITREGAVDVIVGGAR